MVLSLVGVSHAQVDLAKVRVGTWEGEQEYLVISAENPWTRPTKIHTLATRLNRDLHSYQPGRRPVPPIRDPFAVDLIYRLDQVN